MSLLIIFSIARVKHHRRLNKNNNEDQSQEEQQHGHNNNDERRVEINQNSMLPLHNDETNDNDEDSRMLNTSSTVNSFVNNVGNSSVSSSNCESPPMSFDELIKDSCSSESFCKNRITAYSCIKG